MNLLCIFTVLNFIIIFNVNAKFKDISQKKIHCPLNTTLLIPSLKLYSIILNKALPQTKLIIKDQSGDSCEINEEEHICTFQKFSNKIQISCFSKNDIVSILIVQPIKINPEMQQIPVSAGAIMPYFENEKRTIVTYEKRINMYQRNFKDHFVKTKCIQQIQQFLDKIYVALKFNVNGTSCVLVSKDMISAIWINHRVTDVISQKQHVKDFFEGNSKRKYIIKSELKSNTIYLNLILDELNQDIFHKKITIKISVGLIDILGKNIEEVQYFLEMNNINKIQLYFTQYIINSLEMQSSSPKVFNLKFTQQQLEFPFIEQNQLLFYYTKGYKPNKYQVHSSIKSKKKIQIIKSNISSIEVKIKHEEIQQLQNKTKNKKQSDLAQKLQQQQQNKYHKIELLQVGKHTYINLPSQTIIKQQQYSQYKIYIQCAEQYNFFTFLMKTYQEPKQLLIDHKQIILINKQSVNNYYYLSKQTLIKQNVQEISLFCYNCHIFATYNLECFSISCCQYLHSQKLPNNRKKLKIFITALNNDNNYKFSNKSLGSIIIKAINKSFVLYDGIYLEGKINFQNYFTYFNQENSDLQFSCVSASMNMILLITSSNEDSNTQEFPSLTQYENKSNQCYLYLKNVQANTTLRITLHLLQHNNLNNNSWNYKIIANKIQNQNQNENSNKIISIDTNKQYYNYYQPNISKQYQLKLINNYTKKYYLQIHLFTQSFQQQQIQLIIQTNINQNQTKQIYYSIINKIKTINLNNILSNLQKNINYNNNNNNLTNIYIKFNHYNNNVAIKISFIIFTQETIFEVTVGSLLTINQIIGHQVQCYCRLDSEQAINVYISSENIKILAKTEIVYLQNIKRVKQISYPIIQHQNYISRSMFKYIASNISNETSTNKSNQNIYNNISQSISEINNNKKYKFILLTIKIDKQSLQEQKHSLNIIISQQRCKLYAQNHIQYRLLNKQQKIIIYNLNINLQTKQIIFFYTTQLQGLINLSTYIIYNNIKYFYKSIISSIIISTFQIEIQQIYNFLKLNDVKLEINQSYQQNIELEFHMKCNSSNCLSLSSLDVSNFQYRRLISGILEPFTISQHSMMVFIYNNEEDDATFKIKIDRSYGFPTYKICASRSIDNAYAKCLRQLESQQDMFMFDNPLILTNTTSHEIIIDKQDVNYCKKCIYFLALYSKYDRISGSIFIISHNKSIIIPEGHSVSTVVNKNQPDLFEISSTRLYAIIITLQGQILIEVIDKYFKNLFQYTINTSIIINLNNQTNINTKYYLKISSTTNKPSLYSLIIVSNQNQIIQLKDSKPLELILNSSKRITYQYEPKNQDKIIINTLQINLLHYEVKCIKTTEINNNSKIQSNKYTGRIQISVSAKNCNLIELILLNNKQQMNYSIIVSTSGSVKLPLNRQIPGLLSTETKTYQLYKLVINDGLTLKFMLKLCRSNDAHFMLFKDNYKVSSLNAVNALFTIQISSSSSYETIIYQVRPGNYYLKIELTSNGQIQYILKVINSTKSVNIQAKFQYDQRIHAKMIDADEKQKQYCIEFSSILTKKQYQIKYYLIQTTKYELLRKLQNCNGQYFNLLSHSNDVKQTQIIAKLNKNNKLQFNYSTKNPSSHITIVPKIIKYHQQLQLKYSQLELSSDNTFTTLGPFLSQLASYLNKYFGIHNFQSSVMIILIIVFLLILILILFLGIYLGSRLCTKTRNIYIQQKIKQQQKHDELQQSNQAIEDDFPSDKISSSRVNNK